MKKALTNGQVRVDKGIPIPARTAFAQRQKYPWLTLDIGDSFLMESKANRGSIVQWANLRYPPRKFISRSTSEGIRVWRTE